MANRGGEKKDVRVSALVDDGVAKILTDGPLRQSGIHVVSFCGFSVMHLLITFSYKKMFLSCVLLFAELNEKEPSMSTILTNFGNSFDPYDALSTPLYQTATFKQVYIPAGHGFMHQKS